jgi:adenylate cyclase
MLLSALALGVAMSRLSLALAFLLAVALVAAIGVSGQIALAHYGVWQANVVPITAIMLTFMALSLYRYGLLDQERRHIRRVFQRYLAPNMVDKVVSDARLPQLGGELRDLTILFCDLRGFTALSERLDATALTRIVNQFFTVATEAILEQGGTIDKYLGDAIMAFWNAPTDQPDHAALACRAALRILDKVDGLNETAPLDGGLPRLKVGVGINTGPCTVGNFGSSRRFDYSAIGDAVNVAARLEHETRTYGIAILLGPETAARAADLAVLPIARIRLRGRAEPLEIYALVGDEQVMATPAFRELRSVHLQLGAASMSPDEARIRSLIDELKARAPPGRRLLYEVFTSHATDKSGALENDPLF